MADYHKKKKKVCQMCSGKTFDYKDVESLKIIVMIKEKFYQKESLVVVLNIKDILLMKLKKLDLWLYYLLLNKDCYAIFFFRLCTVITKLQYFYIFSLE